MGLLRRWWARVLCLFFCCAWGRPVPLDGSRFVRQCTRCRKIDLLAEGELETAMHAQRGGKSIGEFHAGEE